VPTHGPGHLKTFDYTGLCRYSLTFCCHSRRCLFTSAPVVNLVLSQILRAARDEQFALLAYCFMPDHAHLLVEALSEFSKALRFTTHAKQLSGFHYGKACHNRLWQRYSYEHVLRDDEDTRRVARNIFENPIRGGLVERANDYPFLGSCVFTVDEILEGTTSG
jgi:putative transposase